MHAFFHASMSDWFKANLSKGSQSFIRIGIDGIVFLPPLAGGCGSGKMKGFSRRGHGVVMQNLSFILRQGIKFEQVWKIGCNGEICGGNRIKKFIGWISPQMD